MGWDPEWVSRHILHPPSFLGSVRSLPSFPSTLVLLASTPPAHSSLVGTRVSACGHPSPTSNPEACYHFIVLISISRWSCVSQPVVCFLCLSRWISPPRPFCLHATPSITHLLLAHIAAPLPLPACPSTLDRRLTSRIFDPCPPALPSIPPARSVDCGQTVSPLSNLRIAHRSL